MYNKKKKKTYIIKVSVRDTCVWINSINDYILIVLIIINMNIIKPLNWQLTRFTVKHHDGR